MMRTGCDISRRPVYCPNVIEVHAYEHTALDVFAMRELPPIGALRSYLNGITSKPGLFLGKQK